MRNHRLVGARAKALVAAAGLIVSGLIPLLAPPAGAALAAFGPTNTATGFPFWYQDVNGMQLGECTDAVCPTVRPDLTTPAAEPGNMPQPGGEDFYWAAWSTITGPGATFILVESVEGTFLPTEAPGNQVAFQRIRLRARTGLIPGASYTFTYPYGQKTFVADARGGVNDTVDTGCLAAPCGASFGAVLNGPFSNFLTWDPAVGPAAPAGYIGDFRAPHPVVGSPTGNNFFRVDGPNVGGAGVNTISTNLFQVGGKFAFPVQVQPAALAFPTTAVGTASVAQNVTVTNTGSTPLSVASVTVAGANAGDFPATNGCTAAVAPGSNCVIGVTFAPAATGNRSASLSIADNQVGSPRAVALSGTAVQPLTFAPTALAFGNQGTDARAAARNISVTNTGNAAVVFSSFAITGTNPGDFAITANTCPASPASLAVGAACSVSVDFGPTAGGARSASLAIVDNAPGSPQSLALTGTGVVPTPGFVANPATLAFGNQLINSSSASRSTTVTNNGTKVLTITSVSVTGTGASSYSVSSNTCPASPATLGIGATCSIGVTFTPTTGGAKSAAVSVVDDAPGSPHTVSLSGTGTLPQPAASFSPTSLAFPDTARGATSADLSVTLTNTGQAQSVLHVGNVVTAGGRAQEFVVRSNGCVAAALAVGQSCTVIVAFAPQGTGVRSATLNFSTDAPTTPAVALSGTGTNGAAPPPPPPPNNNPPPPPPPNNNPPPPPPPKNGGKGKG